MYVPNGGQNQISTQIYRNSNWIGGGMYKNCHNNAIFMLLHMQPISFSGKNMISNKEGGGIIINEKYLNKGVKNTGSKKE